MNSMSSAKVMLFHLTVGLVKLIWYNWVNIFLNQTFRGNVKIKLDLSNYITKSDSENATGVDTSDFAKKVDLVTLKSEFKFDKLDISAGNTSGFVKKAGYDTKIKDINKRKHVLAGNESKNFKHNETSLLIG